MGDKEERNLRSALKQSKLCRDIISSSQAIWLNTTYGFFSCHGSFRFLSLFSPTRTRSCSLLLCFTTLKTPGQRRRGGFHLPTQSHWQPPQTKGSCKPSLSQDVAWDTSKPLGTQLWCLGHECSSAAFLSREQGGVVSPFFLVLYTRQLKSLSNRTSF